MMLEARMDLCNWECSLPTQYKGMNDEVRSAEQSKGPCCTKVLGLIWNRKDDTLS
jgi:hypothetical protein